MSHPVAGVKLHLWGEFDLYPAASASRQMRIHDNAQWIVQKRVAAGIGCR